MVEKSIIVDCDAGIDDALALILLIAAHKIGRVNIKAITCVNGNTSVENVVKNVYRVLEICNATDIPVFQGAYAPLLAAKNTEEYYGKDGFGDVCKLEPDLSKLQEEHAICALNRIVSEDPGNISVVCLGPLTNIAMAIKMYPTFMDNVKDFYVMGGNFTGRGNTTSQAEFNFYMDPESVHIVLSNMRKSCWLLPWETCLYSNITHEWRENVLGRVEKPWIQLMNEIEEGRRAAGKKQFPNYICCDAFMAGIFLKSDMIKTAVPYHADIELHGNRTRGQVVLDHLLQNKPNVHIIQDFDTETFKELLLSYASNMSHANVEQT